MGNRPIDGVVVSTCTAIELREHAERVAASARKWRENGSPVLAAQMERIAEETEAKAAREQWRESQPELETPTAATAVDRASARWGDASKAVDWKEIDGDGKPTAIDAKDALAPIASALRVIEVGDLSTVAIAVVHFVIAQLVPRGVCTLLAGHGGVGKSMLMLILAAHVACGKAWAGLSVAVGRAVFVTLEDSAELVRWRLRAIAVVCELDAGLLARNLIIVDGHDGDGSLVVEASDAGVRRIVPTPNMIVLRELAKGASLVAIDNASDAFDGDENVRRQVRAFFRELGGIARAQNAAVMLAAHVDKVAARNGKSGAANNGYSGSTAWHNSARSRIALSEADGMVELAHEKSNLGKKIDPIRLRFVADGVLVPCDSIATGDQAEGAALIAAADADSLLLAIRGAVAAGVNVPTARTGPATAQLVLSTMSDLPKALQGSTGRARFWDALERLRRSGRVSSDVYRNQNRHERTRWMPV
jgi:hypothetical protein